MSGIKNQQKKPAMFCFCQWWLFCKRRLYIKRSKNYFWQKNLKKKSKNRFPTKRTRCQRLFYFRNYCSSTEKKNFGAIFYFSTFAVFFESDVLILNPTGFYLFSTTKPSVWNILKKENVIEISLSTIFGKK